MPQRKLVRQEQHRHKQPKDGDRDYACFPTAEARYLQSEGTRQPISFEPLKFKRATANAKAAFGSMMNLRNSKNHTNLIMGRAHSSAGVGEDYGATEPIGTAHMSQKRPFAGAPELASLDRTTDIKIIPASHKADKKRQPPKRLLFN